LNKRKDQGRFIL